MRAALKAAAAGTIPTGREGAGFIFEYDDGTFSFTAPVWGTKGSVNVGVMFQALAAAMAAAAMGKTRAIVAIHSDYHNHGTDYKPGYESFSPEDRAVTRTLGQFYGPRYQGAYLGTPTRAIHFESVDGTRRPVDPGFGPHIDTRWGRDPSRAPPEVPRGKNYQGGATVPPIYVAPRKGDDDDGGGTGDLGRPGTNGLKDNTFAASTPGSTTTAGAPPAPTGGPAKPPESSGIGNQTSPPAGAVGVIGVGTPSGWGAWVLTWNGSAWGYVWTSPDGAPPPGDPPPVPQDPPPADPAPDPEPDPTPDDEDDSGDGDGTVTGSDDDDDDATGGNVGGYVDPNDTTGTGNGGRDESRRFHSNYLPMETRALLGFAELARGHAPERPAPPGGGPTDRGGWKPVRARGAAATHPPEGPPGGNRLRNALVDDAASRLMGGARIPRMGTDGPGQVPLNAAALAKAARPILRTVGDAEEAAAKASRDELRQLLYNEHVAPIIRTMVGARDLARRGAR